LSVPQPGVVSLVFACVSGITNVYSRHFYMAQNSLQDAELRKLNLEITQLDKRFEPELEKLKWEISGLRASQAWDRRIGRYIPLATTLVGVGAFWLGVQQYTTNEKEHLAQNRRQMEQDWAERAKDYKKYFWEKQLDTYSEAVDLAARLANDQDPTTAAEAYSRFVELYHGRMVIYEDLNVMQAMKRFEQVYIEYRQDPGLQNEAKTAARDLARECRKSAADSWDIPLQTLDMSKF
jgi:hypothetical protein